jgi:hypothetical protein
MSSDESDQPEAMEMAPPPPRKTKVASPPARSKKTVSLAGNGGTSRPPAQPPAPTAAAKAPGNPKYAPYDELRRDAEATREKKNREKVEELAKRPFAVCDVVQDMLHVAILQFLSNNTKVAHDNAGFSMIVVDDEAVDFHTDVAHQSDYCRPVRVLLYRPFSEDELLRIKNGTKKQEAAVWSNRDTKFIQDLDVLSNAAIGYLSDFFRALPPATLVNFETQCNCKIISATQGPFELERNLQRKSFTISFVYTNLAGVQNSFDVFSGEWYWDADTQGPVPKFTPYARRLYGTLGYLLDRAERLLESNDAEVTAYYDRQYKQLKRIIRDGAVSCASFGSSSKACLIQTLARYSPEEEGELARAAHALRKESRNPEALVRRLVDDGFYPPSGAATLFDAIQRQKLDYSEVETLVDRIEQSMRRPRGS